MFPTLIQLGPFRFPTYATLLSLGLIGAALLSIWQAPRRGLLPIHGLDAVILAAVGGLVGARVAYVAVNWAYYRDHIAEALRLWAGGLTWQGGLVFGLLLVAVYGWARRLSLVVLLDVLSLGFAWFVLFLWLGTGTSSDVYGRETYPGDGLLWTLSADLPDLYGLQAPRVNITLLGVSWSGLVLIALLFLQGRLLSKGYLFFTFALLTGLGGLFLVPLQANSVPYLFRIHVDWLFYLLLTLVAAAGLVAMRRHATGAPRRLPNHE